MSLIPSIFGNRSVFDPFFLSGHPLAPKFGNKNDKWHRVERGRGKFLRRFWLPENAKIDQVTASVENGVVTVTVPKMEEKKPEVKSIQISG